MTVSRVPPPRDLPPESGAAAALPGPGGRRRRPAWRVRLTAVLLVLGPGLVSGFADNDAGGITTYSLAGVQFGYELLWVILASQVALFFTQEIGARLGLATGQGMTGLIRERFGVRWAAFVALAMLVANLGTTVAEFAGIGAALELFGVPVPVSALISAVAVVVLISWGSFSRVQYLFVAVGVGVSAAYVASAVLAHPDWGRAATSLVVPHGALSATYWVAVVGTVGTTITPWGQGFIQAYVVDKRLGPEDLGPERVDVGLGSFITNLIAAFIVVACAATLWSHGERFDASTFDASQAARALEPLAGPLAEVLFAVGLLAASLLGLGVVPLASAYTGCEAFGWEAGVEWRWREAPAFYGLLAFFVGFAALFVLVLGPDQLVPVMFLSQVLNGLLLPFILVFVMLLSSDQRLLGPLASGRLLLAVGWLITAALALMSLVFVATQLLPSG
ncbi:MAG TPA: Nramp family divalent metal transporter [Candidatus Limnocylindrales bacterium]